MDEHFLRYEIEGLKGIHLENNDKRICLNNPYIKEIYINDDLNELCIYLKEAVNYKKNKEQIDGYINGIFFNFLINEAVVIECPRLLLKQEYGGDQLVEENNILFRQNPVLTSIHIQTNEFCKEVEKENFVQKCFIDWKIASSILQNPDPIVVFLLLYDYTKEKIGHQKEFVKYLDRNKQTYGSDLTFQKDDRGQDVDLLTFTRNTIAHCKKGEDYTKLSETVSSSKIRLLLKILNDILLSNKEE